MGVLFYQNVFQTAMNLALLVHTFLPNSPYLLTHVRLAQYAMCFDIVNALTGLVRSNPATVALQIVAKIVVVTLGEPTHFRWLAMVWAMSDATRYAHHLSGHPTLAAFRYSQYKVLYPIGVSLELVAMLPVMNHLAYKMGILALYAMFSPRMFNHTSKLETHRTIVRLLSKYADADTDADTHKYKVEYKKQSYFFTFENIAHVRARLCGARFNWKPTEQTNVYTLRDFGIQVSWRLVYLVEYAGALVAYPFMVAQTVGFEASLERLDVWLWTLHYGKRLLESAFVHTFASDTMPFANIFKNSLYYWGAGVVLGALAPASFQVEHYATLALWGVCEVGNLFTHLYLANLRRGKDPKERVLPMNGLFRVVVSPNYGFEILSWVCFALLEPRWSYYTMACLTFALMGAAQMYVWAGGKRRRYKKIFGDKYKTHWRVLPLI